MSLYIIKMKLEFKCMNWNNQITNNISSAYINWKFVDRIASQVKSFKKGINDVIPLSKLAVSTQIELIFWAPSQYTALPVNQFDYQYAAPLYNQ